MMPSLKNIILTRSIVATGNWRLRSISQSYSLYHYDTLMLLWNERSGVVNVGQLDIGYGSKSDQDGMNTAFSALNLPYRYVRKGGKPRIILDASQVKQPEPEFGPWIEQVSTVRNLDLNPGDQWRGIKSRRTYRVVSPSESTIISKSSNGGLGKVGENINVGLSTEAKAFRRRRV